MWTETILARDDIDRLLAQLMPFTLDLGSDGDHVTLTDPEPVELVPEQGVRLKCAAKLRWSVLGIAVPLTVRSVTLMLRPSVTRGDHGRDVLSFALEIEHADLSGIPEFIDERITDKANEAIRERQGALAWDFSSTLSRSVDLPAAFGQDRRLSVDAAWGKIRVTDEALVMAMSFHALVTDPESQRIPLDPTPPVVRRPLTTRPAANGGMGLNGSNGSNGSSGVAGLAAVGALVALGGYGAFRLGARNGRRREERALAGGAATLAAASLMVKLGASVARRVARAARS
jgi:hypothetical protein